MIIIDNLQPNTSKEFLLKFGEVVKKERNKQNLTQRELADKVGVSHEWICKIEKGKANTISLNLLHTIKEKLGLQKITM